MIFNLTRISVWLKTFIISELIMERRIKVNLTENIDIHSSYLEINRNEQTNKRVPKLVIKKSASWSRELTLSFIGKSFIKRKGTKHRFVL